MVFGAGLQPSEELPFRFFESMQFSDWMLSFVYIGTSGIYVIVNRVTKPDELYGALCELLQTGKVRLYLIDAGYFDPQKGLVPAQLDEDALSEHIIGWIFSQSPAWGAERLDFFAGRLQWEDCRMRGRYRDENGSEYILKHGAFYRLSPRSSEGMFYLTLFGGILGMHRFLSGKIFSGLVYFCTGGLICIGWLLDLLSLFLGVQKDKKGRYIAPLKNPVRKLIVLPFGILASAVLLFFQLHLWISFSEALNGFLSSVFQNVDPVSARVFEGFVRNLINRFSGGV